ncbi:MAG: T9SS type A sorting domain-containing protein [Desulfobulbaceae bacterium]|nr:T9SS type A sorting domain-containing protein [Desulfobulbaceae bacterium]
MRNLKKTMMLLVWIAYSVNCQNYFPLKSIKSLCVKTDYSIFGPIYTSGTYYSNTYHINDTLINSQKFFIYKFDGNVYYLNEDSVTQRVYIYLPNKDSIYLALDFNLEVGSSEILYIKGSPLSFECTVKDSIWYWDRYRKRFGIKSGYKHYMEFLEDVGLIYDQYREYPFYYSYSIFSIIIGEKHYNPVIMRIDSINAKKDRPIDTFPFVLIMYGYLNYNLFIDSIYADLNVIRNDTLVFSNKFGITPISSTLYYANISIDTAFIKVWDTIKLRVVYKDNSIFWTYVTFPDSGFISFTILPPITSIDPLHTEILTDFQLYDIYPNPFNSIAKIKFNLPANDFVTIKLYDIMGRETDIISSEQKDKGLHIIEFNCNLLSSGVYIIRLQTNKFLSSKKVVIMK